MDFRRAMLALCVSGFASGCSVDSPPDRFAGSGRMIALSGAAAGAAGACFSCHGLDGGGNGAGVPRIAGLDRGYLVHQMEAYADGRRINPSMRWISGQLTNDQRLAVSSYYANLPAPERTGGPAGDPSIYFTGDPERDLPACATCHGVDGLGVGAANPPLAGQPAPYLAQQLEAWRRGERRSDPANAMLAISRKLTPAEIAAVSAFAASLPQRAQRPERPAASQTERRFDPRNDASGRRPREAG